MSTVIKIENLSKLYRLGDIGTGTISQDMNRFWAKIRGKEDPFLKLGAENDRANKGDSDFVWALKDINFEVKQGEVLGIVGNNGAGKSTLLKILSRTTTPTTGFFKVKGRIASLLEVGTGFHPELSGRENIFLNGAILGMTKKEIKSKFDEIVDFSGVERYIDTPVKRYSSGMYVRLAFAVAAHLESEILILDEVLAVGDSEFQKKCLGKMKDASSNGRTVLFVSHNMSAIKSICSKAIFLEKGTITLNGDINLIVEKYLNINTKASDISSAVFDEEKKYIQILEASIIGNNDKTADKPFDVFDPLSIKIKYKFSKKIAKVHLTMIISNSAGEEIYFVDRRDVASNFASVGNGVFQSVLNIANPLLKPGKYFVTLGCSDIEEGINDHKFQVLSFTIDGSTLTRNEREGHLFLPIKWELNKMV